MSLAAPLRLLSVVFAISLAAAPGPAVPDEGVPVERARAFVAEIGGEVVAALQSGGPLAEREVAIRDIFQRGFDIETIARFVLGRYWRLATPEQQAAYLDAYHGYFAQNYADRLAGETVSSFAVIAAHKIDDRQVIVDTKIERPDVPPLNYGWRVRDAGGGQKVVDVVVEGVSLLITQRSDFGAVIQNQGLDGLIESLRQKVAKT